MCGMECSAVSGEWVRVGRPEELGTGRDQSGSITGLSLVCLHEHLCAITMHVMTAGAFLSDYTMSMISKGA